MSTSTTLDQTASNVCEWVPGYELMNPIGTGGCGVVYKARQLALDRLVAIKLIRFDHADSQELTDRFEKEAVTLGKLHHPNIVQIFDYGRHAGRVYLTMELLEGEDLAQLIQRKQILDERTGWAIARQTAAALAHAAGNGVIHRDVKPANLFLVPAPTGMGWAHDVPFVKVMDFGLAFTKSAVDADEIRLTRTNTTPGTPLYMAPEQSRKSAELDQRADIYALGATIFHCLSGRPPFAGPTMWDLMLQKLDHKLKFEPHLSAETVELLKAMMALEPKDRIGTYEELIARLEGLKVMKGTEHGMKPIRVELNRSPHEMGFGSILRNRWYWLTAACFIGLAGAGLALRGESNSELQYEFAANQYQTDGPRSSFFGGSNASMTDWTFAGRWTTEKDSEKATVLAGNGFIRKAFQPEDNYRITIGLDLYEARAVEVHFAIADFEPEKSKRMVLRVTKEQGAVLGSRLGENGNFKPAKSAPVPFLPSNWSEDSQPYFEVKFVRAGELWMAWYNGRPVGHAIDDGSPKLAEFRIGTEGGKARIDSAEFTKLKRP